NVDNLHEKAGSTRILHLHGELMKVRSTTDPDLVYDITEIDPDGWQLKMTDTCRKGSLLRPHIVWFGEEVPMMLEATKETVTADIFIVIGTSLVVYPAAGLLNYVAEEVSKFIIDPNLPEVYGKKNLFMIAEKATVGMKIVVEQISQTLR
ncbi:MAG: NAD-dependent deacylase, partial [Verrucomicrobia bacterium]|nr:NAD-dependent deacylase [Cytophagales bacterium]